jgi:hypothetical protein
MKLLQLALLIFLLGVAGLSLVPLSAQGVFIPIGSGAHSNQFYASAIYTNPQPYSPIQATTFGLGYGIGNPEKAVAVQAHLATTYFEELGLSGSLKIHKDFGLGTTMAVGAMNLLQVNFNWDYSNYFIALSHDFRHNFAPRNPLSRLSFTAGAGYGRSFTEKYPKDIIRLKEEKGTIAFGALALRLTERISVEAEWTGVNLNTFASYRGYIRTIPLGISIGAGDLTPYSGDRVFFILGVTTGMQFR